MYKKWLLLIAVLCLLPLMGVYPKTDTQSQGEEAIVLVTFGTSAEEARAAYEDIEKAVRAHYPDTAIHWIWSDHPLLRADANSDLRKAIQKTLTTLAENGVKYVDVLTLHMLPDAEIIDLLRITRAFEGLRTSIRSIRLALPLLDNTHSLKDVARILLDSAPAERTAQDALLFVGHGTRHRAGVYYAALHYFLHNADNNAFVATIDDTLPPEAILHSLQAKAVRKVWLIPLMTVADKNALNDIFGTDANSWHQRLAAQGIQAELVPQGLRDNPAMVQQWLRAHHKRMNF